nr:hypothetical protein [Tanacetum cinerariifolium]
MQGYGTGGHRTRVGGFCWEVMEVHGRISGKWWSGRKNRGYGLVQVSGKIGRSNSRFKRGEEDRGEVWHIYIVSPCGYLRTDLVSPCGFCVLENVQDQPLIVICLIAYKVPLHTTSIDWQKESL